MGVGCSLDYEHEEYEEDGRPWTNGRPWTKDMGPIPISFEEQSSYPNLLIRLFGETFFNDAYCVSLATMDGRARIDDHSFRTMLESLETTRVKVLDLRGSSVSDDMISEFGRIRSLQFVIVEESGVTESGVASIRANLPHLYIVTDAGAWPMQRCKAVIP